MPSTAPATPTGPTPVTATSTGTSRTRVGTFDVAIPKLRQGSVFPGWLLQRHRRAEQALTSVVATCYLLGVSTRRMDKLVQALGITGLSKSQVSATAKDLDTGPAYWAQARTRSWRQCRTRRPGHLRRARRPGQGDRRDVARHQLAAVAQPAPRT